MLEYCSDIFRILLMTESLLLSVNWTVGLHTGPTSADRNTKLQNGNFYKNKPAMLGDCQHCWLNNVSTIKSKGQLGRGLKLKFLYEKCNLQKKWFFQIGYDEGGGGRHGGSGKEKDFGKMMIKSLMMCRTYNDMNNIYTQLYSICIIFNEYYSYNFEKIIIKLRHDLP